MKFLLVYCALVLTLPLGAQLSFSLDTINIGEVVINGNRGQDEPAGYKREAVDSSILELNPQMSLAGILSQYSPIFIKSYGMGGTASPSLRGTGAGHTRLTWNGINLTNPMLGQSDLSLYPAGFTDGVQIYYGGASMPVSSGGIGGIVNLETIPVWKSETLLSLNCSVGSFGQYTGLARARTGNSRFQSVTKGFYQSSENDFPFRNTSISNEPVWQKRSNSQVIQRGFMQEFYIRRAKNTASARVWYGSANRNLPSSMLVQQPGLNETQFDESLRSMLSFDHYGVVSKLSLTGAYLMNRLDYSNSLADVDSRNTANTMVVKAEYGLKLGRSLRMRSTVTEELHHIKTNNYGGNASRNNLSFDIYAEKGFRNRLISSFLVREILDASQFLIPDFTAGLQYRLTDYRDWFLKANVSRNSKIPSLNDLYWSPGGNPDLKNEYAFMYEITGEIHQDFSRPLAMKLIISAFMNNIRDMIQWMPGEYSYWTAQNIKNVNTSGIESSGSLNYKTGRLELGFNTNYSYTRATTVSSGTPEDVSVGRQLVYIPMHQANCSLLAGYGRFYSSWNLLLNSRRYLNVENTSYLPGYVLNNLLAGVKLKPKKLTLDFSFQIDNIFDVSYQTIAYYPLPGRSYSLKLLLQILK